MSQLATSLVFKFIYASKGMFVQNVHNLNVSVDYIFLDAPVKSDALIFYEELNWTGGLNGIARIKKIANISQAKSLTHICAICVHPCPYIFPGFDVIFRTPIILKNIDKF